MKEAEDVAPSYIAWRGARERGHQGVEPWRGPGAKDESRGPAFPLWEAGAGFGGSAVEDLSFGIQTGSLRFGLSLRSEVGV